MLLADFGLAKQLPNEQLGLLVGSCGTKVRWGGGGSTKIGQRVKFERMFRKPTRLKVIRHPFLRQKCHQHTQKKRNTAVYMRDPD